MEIIAIVISLASFIVAVWSVKVSKDTARKQLEYAEKTEKRREEKEKLAEEKREREKRQEQLDWREAERRVHESPFPIHGTLEDCIEQEYRRVRSERILRGRG
jgi:flagellar biosynthesis/type III secretory pathway M-ring protein FliF/YscJ